MPESPRCVLPSCSSSTLNEFDSLARNYSLADSAYVPSSDSMSADLAALYFILPGIIGSSICLLGLLGSILNVGMLSLAVRQASKPTYHILLVLAISNGGVMVVYLMFSLTFFVRPEPIVRPTHVPKDASAYQVLLFSTWYLVVNTFVCASNWFVVAVTFFRFLAVRFPMKVGLWCTPWRVRSVIVSVFVLSIVVILPDMLTIELHGDGSGHLHLVDTPLYNDPAFVKVYYTVMHFFVHLLPYVVNVFIVTLLLRTLRGSGLGVLKLKFSHGSSRDANNRRITVMLVVMVIFSLVTTLPSLSYMVMRDFAGVRDIMEGSPRMMVFRAVCDVIELLNHACHFYINLASNSTYRSKFVRTMSCLETRSSLRRASQQIVSSMYMSSLKRPTLDNITQGCRDTLASASLIIAASSNAQELHGTSSHQTRRSGAGSLADGRLQQRRQLLSLELRTFVPCSSAGEDASAAAAAAAAADSASSSSSSAPLVEDR